MKLKTHQKKILIKEVEKLGFRAGRSTADHLFSLTKIIEKKTSFLQEIHLLFVDLENAYDNVLKTKSGEIWNKYKCQLKDVNNLHCDTTLKKKIAKLTSIGFRNETC